MGAYLLMTESDPDDRTSLGDLSLDFWFFWTGQAISTLGSSFTVFALPLLVFRLTGSALNLSVSTAVSYLPVLLFGLVIGAWVDRMDRKRVMLGVNLLLALSVGSIPLADATGHLSVVWIYAAQFCTSSIRLFFTAAQFAAIPSLVPRDRLVTANGRIQASYSAMSVIGPLLAGALSAFLPLSALLVVDACSYIVSASALLLVRRSFNAQGAPPPRHSIRSDISEGVRFIFGHPVLRNISLMMLFVNFASQTVASQIVYFSKVQLSASNTEVGLMFSANAVGMFALSMLAGPLRRSWPFSRVALGLLEIQGFMTILIAQLHIFWLVVPLLAMWQGVGTLFSINTTSVRQTITPNYLLGRVVSTAGVLGGAVIPFGTLAGGYAIQRTHNISLVFSVIGVAVFLIPVIFSFTALGRAERYLPDEAVPGPASTGTLATWVRAASTADTEEASDHTAPSTTIASLSPEEVRAVEASLDGIYESSREIIRALDRLPDASPDPERLQSTLATVRSDIEDITYHWQELTDRLPTEDTVETSS
jgi:MFS family permease